MAKSDFENLKVYQMSETLADESWDVLLRRAYKRKLLHDSQVNTIKPLVDNLAPMLNAYLRSIGPVSNRSKA